MKVKREDLETWMAKATAAILKKFDEGFTELELSCEQSAVVKSEYGPIREYDPGPTQIWTIQIHNPTERRCEEWLLSKKEAT